MNQKVNPSALDVQVAGSHYKGLKIQPVEYIHANQIPFEEGCVIKYVTRWREKGGLKDLEKAKHFIDLLIELEAKYPNGPDPLAELEKLVSKGQPPEPPAGHPAYSPLGHI